MQLVVILKTDLFGMSVLIRPILAGLILNEWL